MIIRYLTYGALLAIPIYNWYRCFNEWYKSRKVEDNHMLFLKRHHCVVRYSAGKITGWPSDGTTTEGKRGMEVSLQYEAILYFIRTAKKSLRIAIMLIHVQCIVDEILAAFKRNIKVRIIVDHCYSKNCSKLEELHRAGVDILYYVSPEPDLSSLFHFKYVVKDYSVEGGYLCCGSLNWSVDSVVCHYDDLVFLSKHEVVTDFYNNFEYAWEYITDLNSENDHVRHVLKGV